jgi:hypothetical protein
LIVSSCPLSAQVTVPTCYTYCCLTEDLSLPSLNTDDLEMLGIAGDDDDLLPEFSEDEYDGVELGTL